MGSADSYIGSFISIISKSEIRYEGVLFHIDPHESSIGLKNVRSFGTEGRKKDGPQIPPSEKIYEYIYFRGSDIKDLQVLSSPPVCSTPAIPDDPAIIQFNYLQPPPTATNLLPTGSWSVTNFISNSQIGNPNSRFQGTQLQYQPVGNIGSKGLSHPNANNTEHVVPTYWQQLKEPSTDLSHMQEQSSLRPPLGLVVSPSGQQQMPYPERHASVTSSASSFPESPSPFMPPFNACGSVNLASTLLSSSALSQNPPIGGSSLVSNEQQHQTTNNVLTVLTTGKLSSTMPLASPLTSASDANITIPPTIEKIKSVNGSTSVSQSTPTSLPLIIGMTSSNQIEASMPSLVTPSQLLQSEPANLSSSQSLQTAQKDIEVVHTSRSESLPVDAKDDDKPAVLPLPVASTKKSSRALVSTHLRKAGQEQVKINGLNDATSRAHHSGKSHVNRSMNKLNAAASHDHHGNHARGDRIHMRGRVNMQHGARLHTQPGNKGHVRGAKRLISGAAPYQHYRNQGHGRGRADMISSSPAKFTEDFDFVAMNEKFNKDEVWGELGKSMKTHLKDQQSPSDSEGGGIQHEDAAEQLKVETKAVYVKDDFFDSLSCNSSLNCESKKGRLRFSEQRKLDTETFGDFQMKRSRRGIWGRGRGWSQVSKLGSANGQMGRGWGRGRGRVDAVWSRVT